ncbi:MAG TPA: hypothetical protein VHZ31_05290 [Solirubrobacteraceae bacterium]|jgi:hypothetical protein|nr:hypothetical protein [Solirubrobacteraceae bacterium]
MTRHVTRSTFAALAIAIALTPVTGAGGAVTHSNASFTKSADGACASAGAQITKLPKLTGANLIQTVNKETAIAAKLVTRLEAIKAPAAKASRYRALIKTIQDQSTYLRAGIGALQHDQVSRGKGLLDKADAVGRRGDKLATKLKLPACAKDYSAQG